MFLPRDGVPLRCRFSEKPKNKSKICCSLCYLIGQRTIKWQKAIKYSWAFGNLTPVNHIYLRVKCLFSTVDVPGLVLRLWVDCFSFHWDSVNCLWPPCSLGSLFASSVSGLHIPVGILLNWAKTFSHISVRRCCELRAGLEEQHGCETIGTIQEQQQLFPPTESALHGQTWFFSGAATCWLVSISAVVCEALALEQRVRELVQCLECKCWNDAEMLQSWPKLLCHSCNGNIWYWLNCSCNVINRAQMGNQYLVLNSTILWWNDYTIQTEGTWI